MRQEPEFKRKGTDWRDLLEKHYRLFSSIMLSVLVVVGGYVTLKMDNHVGEFGDKRWLGIIIYERDRAADKSQRDLDRQTDASRQQAMETRLADIKAQNDHTQLSIERSQLETKDAFNRMADLIEKVRESKK